MAATQPKETWQEKLARLENELSKTMKRKIALQLKTQDAKKVKQEARDDLEQFRAQVEHPIFQNLHAILPDALIELCKDYYHYSICLMCESVYSCYTRCIFENRFQASVHLCSEDTERLTNYPSLHTLVSILESHEKHFTLKEQVTSLIDQVTSKGLTFATRKYDVYGDIQHCAISPYSGKFTIDGNEDEMTVGAYRKSGWKHTLFICSFE